MPDNRNPVTLGNLGNIDWNKLKPGIKKEAISENMNTIWAKIDTSGDGEISQAELDVLKNDLAQAIEDKTISKEEAKAYLESKGITDVEDDIFLQFMLQLGNTEATEEETSILKASDFGFVNGKIENVEIDARAAGITNRLYNGVVRIPTNATMPEDGSLPKVLMMELPADYGENQFTKLTYNEADGTYMSRYRDMAFTLEKDEQGKVVLKAVDDEQLKMKRAQNLENWAKEIHKATPTPNPNPNPAPAPAPAPKPDPKPDPKPEQPTKKDLGLDNYYGNSFQHNQGDCYLLASINALRSVDGGQEYLQTLRTEKIVNGEKVYTLHLPGAILAADSLKKDNLKGGVFITGEYTFTESEVEEILAKAGQRYSKGDPDVILLEAAFEKYRTEVQQTLDANNISYTRYWTTAGMYTGTDSSNPLEGGQAHDAVFVLTGKKSELYCLEDYDSAPVLSSSALSQNMALPIMSSKMGLSAVSEIEGNIRRTTYALDNMLDKLEEDFSKDNKSNLIATASFKIGTSEADSGGHAFTVKRVTKDKVILINPWYPNKELEMSREMFIQYCTKLSIGTENAPKSRWQKIKEQTGLDQYLG